MSLKTAVLALPASETKRLTWTRFFKPEITDNLRLARPAPRPPFQGPVSIACPDHAHQTPRRHEKALFLRLFSNSRRESALWLKICLNHPDLNDPLLMATVLRAGILHGDFF